MNLRLESHLAQEGLLSSLVLLAAKRGWDALAQHACARTILLGCPGQLDLVGVEVQRKLIHFSTGLSDQDLLTECGTS